MTSAYEMLEHTADIGVIGSGDDLSEAVEGCLAGLFEVLFVASGVEEKEERVMEVPGEGEETLTTVSLLSQFLVVFYADFFLPARVKVTVGEDGSMSATMYGEVYDADKHKLGTEVKAITYHMLECWEEDGRTLVRVLFDI